MNGLAAIGPLLIANRGEIVVRVAHTAARLGIETIAIASDADAGAPHTLACDRVVAIGGDAASDSYLRIDRVLGAARKTGARAVHPGYGLLSENADFAEAVIGAGLTWIGPPTAAMRAMADKASARQRMAAAGVPVLPGYDGAAQDLATLRSAAAAIGFPVMVKAAAGGGGRGMRLVHDDASLAEALRSAAAEALAAFGDARLLLERAAVAARHVEIQVFADVTGVAIHLGERDCSVQRRHQKVIEEAPSPAVSPALRRRMGEVAVTAARDVGYVGAGTVEFLLAPSGEFWFIEMNTRLQVEHAVTEALIGADLVEWQLRIAAGEGLSMTQAGALARYEAGGHAIEARLCAEAPGHGWLPQSGRIARWAAPAGVRCDHALASGCSVPRFYDSMLAKVVAQAPTRAAAAESLAAALERTVCLGVATNRAFLARLLRDPAFLADDVDTAFLERRFGDDAARSTPAPSWLEAVAAAALALLPGQHLPALWAGWSSSPALDTVVPIGVDDTTRSWHLGATRDEIVASCGDARHRIVGLRRRDDGDIEAEVDGRAVHVLVAHSGRQSAWQAQGAELSIADERLLGRACAARSAPGLLLAPMHGRVTQVLVDTGALVDAGALLLVVEAMKMEHPIRAPHAGTVAALHAVVGAQVAARQPLVEIAP